MKTESVKSTRGRKRGGTKINSPVDESDIDAAMAFHYGEH